jgi:hypothetical protein
MCRNIRPLFNFEPPATNEEILKASEQFVRKISGFSKPSKFNEIVFNEAIDEISKNIQKLLKGLVTKTEPKNREIEAEKVRLKSQKRIGNQ